MTYEDPAILVAIAAGFATLGIGVWKNRSDLKTIKQAIFGHERQNGGLSKSIAELSEDINRIERKIDSERKSREKTRNRITNEIRTTRYLVAQNIDEVVSEINDEMDDVNLDGPDFTPDDFGVTYPNDEDE